MQATRRAHQLCAKHERAPYMCQDFEGILHTSSVSFVSRFFHMKWRRSSCSRSTTIAPLVRLGSTVFVPSRLTARPALKASIVCKSVRDITWGGRVGQLKSSDWSRARTRRVTQIWRSALAGGVRYSCVRLADLQSNLPSSCCNDG